MIDLLLCLKFALKLRLPKFLIFKIIFILGKQFDYGYDVVGNLNPEIVFIKAAKACNIALMKMAYKKIPKRKIKSILTRRKAIIKCKISSKPVLELIVCVIADH
jgi:hypothetical protein